MVTSNKERTANTHPFPHGCWHRLIKRPSSKNVSYCTQPLWTSISRIDSHCCVVTPEKKDER